MDQSNNSIAARCGLATPHLQQLARQDYAKKMVAYHQEAIDKLMNVDEFVRCYENRQALLRVQRGEFQYLTRIRPTRLPEEVDYFHLPYYPQVPGITTVPDYAWRFDRPKIQQVVARVLADWNETDANENAAQETDTEKTDASNRKSHRDSKL